MRKDREELVEYVRMALVMCEIGVTYTTAELIIKVVDRVREKEGRFDVKDAAVILTEHELKWSGYFNKEKDEGQPEGNA